MNRSRCPSVRAVCQVTSTGADALNRRVLIQAAGFNLGLLLWDLIGVGTPRSLQGRALPAIFGLIGPLNDLWWRLTRVWAAMGTPPGIVRSIASRRAA